MARKFTGFGALGKATPELRSALLNIKRSLRGTSQSQRANPLISNEAPARTAGFKQQRGYSRGSQGAVVTFGVDVDKPGTAFLLQRGVGSLVYVATDTNKVYIWNGTAYKSATFS